MVSLALPKITLQSCLQPERSGQLAGLVNALLVIWLAWLLAGLSWLLVPESESESMPLPAVVSRLAQQSKPQIDERQIAEWHIFGVAGEEARAAKSAAATANAPETRLKLTLKGLFASDDNDGWAIIGDPKGKEKSYAVGDPVPGGARISEIHIDRIILERNGRFETLRLPRDRSGKAGVRSPRRATPSRSSNAGQAAAFTKYRKEIKQNPAAFLDYVRATPARKGGKFVGFRLQAGKERGALKELGLQPGDVVTAINGVQIDSPAKGMKAMQALGEGESVAVVLLRGGAEVAVNLTLPPPK